jgi:hypothetical protein
VRNRIVVDVEGVDDPSIVAGVEATIRRSFTERSLPGSWRVRVVPSRVHGSFLLNVQGLNARRTVSIAVPPSLLPELIPLRLRESLERLCSARVVAEGDDDGSAPTRALDETLTA